MIRIVSRVFYDGCHRISIRVENKIISREKKGNRKCGLQCIQNHVSRYRLLFSLIWPCSEFTMRTYNCWIILGIGSKILYKQTFVLHFELCELQEIVIVCKQLCCNSCINFMFLLLILTAPLQSYQRNSSLSLFSNGSNSLYF